MECNAKLQSTEKENLPAMFSGAVEDVAMYANSDFCVPLQKYVDADTEGWQELDDTWDALRSAYSDGQGNLIGYPIGYSYPNIFYNADLLKKAGVDPASIQSFDDLYDASKTIVDGGFATYGIGFFANGAMFNVALGREGVQAYNNENGLNGQPVTECLYDSDTTVHDSIYNMLSIYQKMGAEKLCVPYGADYQSEIIPQMASGDCAMMMGVISMTTKVLDAAAGNFEVGVIPMPSASESGKRTGEPAAGTGTYVCDNGNEKAMQGAYEFIKFASTGEQAGYFASATGYIAPNQEAYDSAAYKTYREETFPGISVVYDSLAKSDSSATNPYVAISNEMRDANKVAMETAATDPTADINTVITTAKDSIQEALDIYNQSNS
ncbi:extracellular solute-binding protein [Gemmiger formicilis]|jgi:sn-glycerol 3-phosphate transport system substrate-binding protein|uniref:extracellular solute-binding protein n=2 Tax=Eubacteriales incertae sedis TaxID=538999 RepID=UPI00399ABE77